LQLLERLQSMIERTYALDNAHSVSRFLVTNPDLLAGLGLAPAGGPCAERVLVAEDDGGMDLAVYLESELLERLAGTDPLEDLHDDNLGDFLTALEGVSHFVYLVWNAMLGKQVTLLELELQAEVDKFVVAAQLLSRQRGGVPPALHDRLFRHFRLVPGLDGEQRRRYLDASRYASDYCRMLARRFMARDSDRQMTPELRHFYRLTQRGKLRHITSRRA
jgi:hypothetical protein